MQVVQREAAQQKPEVRSLLDVNTMPGQSSFPLAKDAEQLVHFSVMPVGHLQYAGVWGTLTVSVLYLAWRAGQKRRLVIR